MHERPFLVLKLSKMGLYSFGPPLAIPDFLHGIKITFDFSVFFFHVLWYDLTVVTVSIIKNFVILTAKEEPP